MGQFDTDKILVIGNCQAQFLEGLFLIAGSYAVDRLQPNFLMSPDDRETLKRKMEEAKFIFIQRTASDYHLDWLRSGTVSATYPDKTWVWPNIYFDGYFPKTNYLYLPVLGKLQGPLEDYHLSSVLDAYKSGEDQKRAISSLYEKPSGAEDPFAESLSNLRRRELDCTVLISDYIEKEIFKSKCFYTPNHPHTPLLVEMARRLADASGISLDVERALTWKYHLEKIDIPVFDWIKTKYRLSFDEGVSFKGLAIDDMIGNEIVFGTTKIYSPDELVAAFYHIYERAIGGRSAEHLVSN